MRRHIHGLAALSIALLMQLAAPGCSAPQAAPAPAPAPAPATGTGTGTGTATSAASLEDSFAKLGGLTNYLEFPHDAATLGQCFDDPQCLRLYADARRAAANVLEGGATSGLDRTLEAIANQCRAPRTDWQARGWLAGWQSCTGAASALFFFSTDAEDQKIANALAQLDEQVFYNLMVDSFGYAEAWVGNRPDRARWVALIRSRPILDHAPVGRAGYENLFRTATTGESRIALVDPRYALTAAQKQKLERAPR